MRATKAESEDRRRSVAVARTSAWLALVFVLLSVSAIVVIPVLMQRQTDAHRDDLAENVDVARTLVTRVQYALAREMSALRGYLLTGPEPARATYLNARSVEGDAYQELDSLVSRIGPDAIRSYTRLRTLSEEWHDRIEGEDGLGLPAEGDEALGARIQSERELYQETLLAAQSLDQAIAAAAGERRRAIARAETVRVRVTAALGVLAALAVLVVAGLGRRTAILAQAADRGRTQVERALEEQRLAVDSKARFIRGITHDIKNPLGAADGFAELLADGIVGRLAPEQIPIVAGIRRCIWGALDIIEDLLDLAGAEAGQIRIRRELIELTALVTSVAKKYEAAARAAGHSLETMALPKPVTVCGDVGRVEQILGNLVSNAIKYTEAPGTILIGTGVRSNGAAGPGRWAAIWVSDNGNGIPPEAQESVFEEFYQLDSTTSGHGLGLALSRRLARLLGGDLTVESEVGRGSTFTLWLPLRSDAAATADDQSTEILPLRRTGSPQ